MRKISMHRVAALAALAASFGAMTMVRHRVPTPPLDPAGWLSFMATTDPAMAVAGVLVPMASIMAGYLFLITLIQTLASLAGLSRTARLLRNLTPVLWRNLVLRPVAVGAITVPSVFGPLVGIAGAQNIDEPALTMTWVATPPAAISSSLEAPALVMTYVEQPTLAIELEEPELATATAEAAEPEFQLVDGEAPNISNHVPSEYIVERGDSLWSIAEQHLKLEFGHRPQINQIHNYWRRLIENNLDRLPDPGNPDLIYAGLALMLPQI